MYIVLSTANLSLSLSIFRNTVAHIEYCITRLDNGVIHDLVWPNDAEMKEAFFAIGRTVISGDEAANVEEEVCDLTYTACIKLTIACRWVIFSILG